MEYKKIQELLDKWNNGTITDDEVIEVASSVMFVPEESKTRAFAQKFKELVDQSRYDYNEREYSDLYYGEYELICFKNGQKHTVANSQNIFIYSSTYSFMFYLYNKGFEIIENYYVNENGIPMLFSITTSTVDKNGFTTSIESYEASDYHKTHMPLFLGKSKTGNYVYKGVTRCGPDRVIKTVRSYNEGELKDSITWETISGAEHTDFGDLSLRHLPTLNEAAIVENNSSKYAHTHPGYIDDVLVNPFYYTEEQIIESVDKIEDEDKKQIVIDELKEKYQGIEQKIKGSHK